ncbi:SDR family NAD(P)-dependent oxidoreductase [Ramlibacter tataouinensis]|uniref:SDR family NAD(P)-dependent oxidoreductase n=1 Tax=Ramlibacter tataouinensis TaxID=94132 RepID=UPI0022F3B495|nr:SDR family NAD(P)-dependent oxidoreductase [Ramlibacter tataouinensis]WBY02378.1 SDR family NAD(P)-dependent oxidoreductase [Ramlibacter tataouinensis]
MPDYDLKGRVAIVTGAGRGIGRAEALALAAEGAAVLVNSRTAESAQETVERIRAAGGEALAAPGDVASEEVANGVVQQALQRYGRLDVLVNNAGAGAEFMNQRVGEMSIAAWDRICETHLRGTFLFCHFAVPAMRARGYGRIINTSSMHALGGGREGIVNYTTAKAGVLGLTRSLAKETGRNGITVNAIAPGFIETDFFSTYPQAFLAQIRSQNPMGRLGTPEDCAALVCFLASRQAGFINGAVLPVDGGRREYALTPVGQAAPEAV